MAGFRGDWEVHPTMNSERFRKAIESATGETIEQLESTTINQRRKSIELRKGAAMRVVSLFPVIGRGSVLRSGPMSHAQVEQMLDEAIQ